MRVDDVASSVHESPCSAVVGQILRPAAGGAGGDGAHAAGAHTPPLLTSTCAVGGLITQETRRPTIDLSRANTLQGLTLLHFSPPT